jgi:hypothetical protein
VVGIAEFFWKSRLKVGIETALDGPGLDDAQSCWWIDCWSLRAAGRVASRNLQWHPALFHFAAQV